MYTQRAPGRVDISLSTANSAQMVLPEPVGAPMSAFSSDEKSVEKTCHVETRGETDGIGRVHSVTAIAARLASRRSSESRACVCIGLKCVNAPSYSGAYCPSAESGSGWRSSSSVCAGYFSGRMRWRKDTGSVVSALSHRSDTTRMKY